MHMNNTNTNAAQMTKTQLIAAGWKLDRKEFSFVFNADIEFWINDATGQKLTRFIR